jgi:riboflavin kinase/FMN adenylyltransferase
MFRGAEGVQDTLSPHRAAMRGGLQMQAVVLGNFDGVHVGHAHLFRIAREAVGVGRVAAVTFEPLPAAVLRPDRPMGRLTPRDERRQLLREVCGVDSVLELEPTPELLGRTPEEFIADLRARLAFDAVIEGPDFRFGRARMGGLDTLRALGMERGFRVIEAPPLSVELTDGSSVEARSSIARALLAEGRVADAACVFGRPYELRCTTTRGDQRGRTIGWPTMNLDAAGRILPADGVYAGEATLPDGRTATAAISVGTKPTFGESPRTCEATLLAPDGAPLSLPLDWYGFPLRLRFHRWIRGMERFGSLEALLARMEVDRVAVLAAAASAAEPIDRPSPPPALP